MALTSTHTHTTFFNVKQVDELVGGAYKALAEDWERRRMHISKECQMAGDARLELLRHTWTLLLEDAD
jgi:hypothetical protein